MKLKEIYKENPYKVKYYTVVGALVVIIFFIFVLIVRYTAIGTLSFRYEYNEKDSTTTTFETRTLTVKW